MQSVYIVLPNTGAVQQFVKVLAGLEGDFELVADNFILDARSFLGIFSMDLSHPVELRIYQPTEVNIQAIQPFLAEQEGKHE